MSIMPTLHNSMVKYYVIFALTSVLACRAFPDQLSHWQHGLPLPPALHCCATACHARSDPYCRRLLSRQEGPKDVLNSLRSEHGARVSGLCSDTLIETCCIIPPAQLSCHTAFSVADTDIFHLQYANMVVHVQPFSLRKYESLNKRSAWVQARSWGSWWQTSTPSPAPVRRSRS